MSSCCTSAQRIRASASRHRWSRSFFCRVLCAPIRARGLRRAPAGGLPSAGWLGRTSCPFPALLPASLVFLRPPRLRVLVPLPGRGLPAPPPASGADFRPSPAGLLPPRCGSHCCFACDAAIFGFGSPPRQPPKPLRDELLSIERLEERALALAASLTVDPNPRHRARDTFRGSRTTSASCAPRIARWPTTCGPGSSSCRRRTGSSTTSTWSRPRSPTSAGICRAPTPARCRRWPRASTPARRASTRSRSSSSATATAGWIASSSSQFLNSYQRVAPLTIGELWAWPSMLKLALIENLRRLAEELLAARAARRAADAYVVSPTTTGRRRPPARRPDTAFIVQLLHRVREYGLRLSPVRVAVDDDLASRHTTAEDTIRGEHQRQGVAQVSVANADHEPAPLRDARLAGVRRVGQPRRAGAAARSRRRVRAHGLPEPRSAAAGRRGAGRAERRRRRCASR